MPYPGLWHPEPLPQQQSTANLYVRRRHSNSVLAQLLWDLWVLVHTSFCLSPPRVCFCTQSPCPCSSPLVTHTSAGDTQHSSGSVSVGSLGPGGHKVCFSPLRVSGGHGFDSKCNFTSLTLLLGQHCAATTPALHCKEQ